jgi:hypothetical protein
MSDTPLTMKQRALEAEAQVKFLASLLDSFWTGDVPDNATPDHMILAKYGRRRLQEIKKQPAIFQ